MQNILKISGIIAICLLCGFILFQAKPTQADIDACVDATNYTAERCKWEITR